MSEGFRYSNRDIRKLDIRHIYSGHSHSSIRLPPPVDHEGLRHLERIHEQMRHPEIPKLPGKHFEYNQEYRIILPSAPAFRRVSKAEVTDIVRRLSSGRKLHTESQNSTETSDERKVSTAPAGRSNRSSGENRSSQTDQSRTANANEISKRLYSARTHTVTLRQREKVTLTDTA